MSHTPTESDYEFGSAKFVNGLEPRKGPNVPYQQVNKGKGVVVRGIFLVIAAYLMEWVWIMRLWVYHNAGLSALRVILDEIEAYEPWFEPQIVPSWEPADNHDNDNHDNDNRDNTSEDSSASTTPSDQDGPPGAITPDERLYYSAADYRKQYLAGTLTPDDVARALLPLIKRGIATPSEHSTTWISTRPDRVVWAARQSTKRYQAGKSLGPLDGIPTAVKDEYDMSDYPTYFGSSHPWLNPEDEAGTTWCVRKLQEAGALVMGKVSMHEFGLDTTGNNPAHGTPRNPHNRAYYPGGSSSGTAYAVSAGLIPLGLGSDGGGSIRIPSSMCGVFGLKPTHGRLSYRPSPNLAITAACRGPIAADMASLAAIFSVVAAPHPTSPFPPLPSPLNLRLPTPSDPKILGIPEDWFNRGPPRIVELCTRVVARLEREHGYTRLPITIPYLPQGQVAHALTLLSDAATLLPYARRRHMAPASRVLAALGREVPASDYLLAQKLRRLLGQHLAWLWARHPGMVIVTPTTAVEGLPIEWEWSEMRFGVNDGDRTVASMEFVWLANFCGLPSLNVPVGFVKGVKGEGDIPIGLMATGEWCSEEQLLQLGFLLEKMGAAERKKPKVWVDVFQEARCSRELSYPSS